MKTARFLLWTYLRLIRPWWSSLWCWVFTRKIQPRTGLWEEYRDLSAKEFSAKLLQIPYSGDPMNGFLDYTITDPDLFWAPGIKHIDCDDFAFMWFLWGVRNSDEAWLIAIMDGLNIRSSHYFTIVRIGASFHLCNYSWDSVPRCGLNECIAQFRKNRLTAWGEYNNPVVVIDKHFKAEE